VKWDSSTSLEEKVRGHAYKGDHGPGHPSPSRK